MLRPGCDVIGGQAGMLFQTGGECGQGWSLAVCGIMCEWQLARLSRIQWW